MVLEETLMVYELDDAEKVAAALRKKGISVRIVRKDVLMRSIAAVGRIRDFKAALEEERAQIGEGEETPRWLSKAISSVQWSEDGVFACMQQHPPGTAIPPMVAIKDLPAFSQMMRDRGAGDEEVMAEVDKIFRTHYALDLLEQNGRIEWTADGGAILREYIEPADLVTSLPVEMIDEAKPEILKRHAISTSIEIISEADYQLEFSPETVMELDLSGFTRLLEEMEIETGSYDEFEDNVLLKRIVVFRALDALEGRGTVSPEEVFEILQSDVFTLSEGGGEVTLDLDLEFVKGLLNDMRKIGAIRKKGAGYRAA